MGDTWQYRVRVTGPDRAAWWERATRERFGKDLISWPMKLRGLRGEEIVADGTWYNVRAVDTPDHSEFLGNHSMPPGAAFSAKDRRRVGQALFHGLDITTEIVGLSWSSDSPTSIYSYRDVYRQGVLDDTACEKADDSSVAEKFAPELVVAFPDPYPPEKRAKWAKEGL